jgi:hypothetical protein
MYGLVNKGIQGLITENYGVETWEKVKEKSNVSIDLFLSNEPYPDEITYDLAHAAAEVLNISLNEVLINFGEYWVINTGQKNYGLLMQAGGSGLKEFLINLPNFHSRVMLIYPKLTPPEFSVTDIKENSLTIHYYSNRQGLKYFVYGLISGLGKMYNQPVKIDIINSRETGSDHEEFMVEW